MNNPGAFTAEQIRRRVSELGEWFSDPAFPKLHLIKNRYAGDPTNRWVPNRACAEAMLRSAGFIITCAPEEEVCRKGHAQLSREPLPCEEVRK